MPKKKMVEIRGIIENAERMMAMGFRPFYFYKIGICGPAGVPVKAKADIEVGLGEQYLVGQKVKIIVEEVDE